MTTLIQYPAGKMTESFTIPESVEVIGGGSIYSSYLKNMHLHHHITEIRGFAINNNPCLKEVRCDFKYPLTIEYGTFVMPDNAVLYVPKGFSTNFQNNNVWTNDFKNIQEFDDEILDYFEVDNISYIGNYLSEKAIVAEVGNIQDVTFQSHYTFRGTIYTINSISDDALKGSYNYICFPTSIKSISSNALSQCKVKSLLWYAGAPLPAEVIKNSSLQENGNWLLYLTNKNYAPDNVRNVVLKDNNNYVADQITLSDDGGELYIPIGFTASYASYTHNYTMQTIKGTCQGWETIVLPFDVEKIVHEKQGELVPYIKFNIDKPERPFWIYKPRVDGFAKVERMTSDTPYLISMPNDAQAYDEEFLLGGHVTFSADGVNIKATKNVSPIIAGDISMVPAYAEINNADAYVLNVQNDMHSETGGKAPGSCFIKGLRKVSPFEAYILSSSNAREFIEIAFADEETNIADVSCHGNSNASIMVTIYTVNGAKVATVSRQQLDTALRQLPHGIYVVNGQKLVR